MSDELPFPPTEIRSAWEQMRRCARNWVPCSLEVFTDEVLAAQSDQACVTPTAAAARLIAEEELGRR